MLQIVSSSWPSTDLFTEAYFESDNSGQLISRYCNESECNEAQGLVTRFDPAVTSVSVAAPEPNTLTLLAVSLLGLTSIRLGRRRKLREN